MLAEVEAEDAELDAFVSLVAALDALVAAAVAEASELVSAVSASFLEANA